MTRARLAPVVAVGIEVHAAGVEAVEVIEAVAVGVGFGRAAEVPFADACRGVAAGLENFGNGELPGREREAIGAHAGVLREAAGQDGGARGGADGRVGVPVLEHGPGSGQGVEVRGAHVMRAEAAEVPAAEVVGHDHDDIGRAARGLGRGGGGWPGEQQMAA